MAVGFRSSSRTGQSDAFVTTLNIPVPSGAAVDDIAVLGIEQWESGNPTITYPAGFTQFINLVSGSQKLKAAWKRLTAADSGNYTCTWTGSQWSIGEAILITGAITSGSPIDATNTATATSTTIPTTTITAADLDFLLHLVANENSATKSPPTNYTETQDSDYLAMNYRIPGTSGSQSAANGTTSTSTLILAALIGILPASGAGAQNIALQVLVTSSTVANPSVTPGSVDIVLPVINSSSTIFAPKIIQIISSPLLATSSTIHSPAVSPGPANVQVPVINNPGTVQQPLVINQGSITVGVLNTSSTVHMPGLVNLLSFIGLLVLNTSSLVLNPSISGGGSPPAMAGSIADIARTNMLADRALTPPRPETNADLMRLVLADGAQVLVPKTEASTATHLLRYMMSLR